MSQQQAVGKLPLVNLQPNSITVTPFNSSDPFDLSDLSINSSSIIGYGKDSKGRKITITDLSTWSRRRNYQCKMLYYCLQRLQNFAQKTMVNPNGSTKNVLTKEEFETLSYLEERVRELITTFSQSIKELKQQEFGI